MILRKQGDVLQGREGSGDVAESLKVRGKLFGDHP
jgi:hypothetical protein